MSCAFRELATAPSPSARHDRNSWPVRGPVQAAHFATACPSSSASAHAPLSLTKVPSPVAGRSISLQDKRSMSLDAPGAKWSSA